MFYCDIVLVWLYQPRYNVLLWYSLKESGTSKMVIYRFMPNLTMLKYIKRQLFWYEYFMGHQASTDSVIDWRHPPPPLL